MTVKKVALSSGMILSIGLSSGAWAWLLSSTPVSAATPPAATEMVVVQVQGNAANGQAPAAGAAEAPPKPARPEMLLPFDPTIRLRGPARNPTLDKNLQVSLQSNFMKEAERWYEDGADVNSLDQQGRSLLYLAIFSNRPENVKFLLLRRANVNTRNEDGSTPMSAAVMKGSEQMMKWLMERGASAAGTIEGSNETFLQYAVKRGLTNIVQLLLDKGGNPNERYENGDSLLKVAVGNNMESTAYQLMQKGAEVDAAGADGITALHEAAAKGQITLAKLLLQRKASVNATSRKNWTPLHHAARFGQYDMVRLLLSQGADPTMRNSDGKTPLHLARQLKHEQIIELLSTR